jgi:transcriptional regulator with XRE-family HTH domain
MSDRNDDRIAAFYRDVGERVKEARATANLTQLNLSKKSGLTRSSIANLEAGRQRVQIHVIALIADTLGVDISSLLPPSFDAASRRSLDTSMHNDLERLSSTARSFVEAGLRVAGSNSGRPA